MPLYAASARAPPIELAIRDIGQLFQPLDPLPFRERDLDASVEAFVVGSAREARVDGVIRIVIHLPAAEAAREEAGHVGDAIRNHFTTRAESAARDLTELFRIGRLSFAIGLGVLALCVGLGTEVSRRAGEGYAGRYFGEGLIILGWVANWKPIEILLYDWWPLLRRQRLYERLARAVIDLTPSQISASSAPIQPETKTELDPDHSVGEPDGSDRAWIEPAVPMPHASHPSDPQALAETIGRRLKDAAARGQGELQRTLARSAKAPRKASRRRSRRIDRPLMRAAWTLGQAGRRHPVALGAVAVGLLALTGAMLSTRRSQP